jgi:hypothetical protein
MSRWMLVTETRADETPDPVITAGSIADWSHWTERRRSMVKVLNKDGTVVV